MEWVIDRLRQFQALIAVIVGILTTVGVDKAGLLKVLEEIRSIGASGSRCSSPRWC